METLKISKVLPAKEFIDAVLNKVTTSTSNTIHARFKMVKIRKFYINKVILCRNEYTKRIRQIIKSFPQINDLSPFKRAMMSILYDFDSYKIALSNLSFSINAIEKASTNSIKLLKYADSSYASKKLKIAAFGHMSKIIKRQNKYLLFLEQVRMHLLRIPKVSDITETLVLCGLPNAGKSSLLNWLTRAKSEIESYAFSTTAIFRGYLEHEGVSKQILDTPGLLDRPFSERNSSEMQAIAAIGKLDCEILFCIDVSYDIKEQITLLKSLTPLLKNDKMQKKIHVIKTKCDLLTNKEETKNLLEEQLNEFKKETGLQIDNILESDGSPESIINLKNVLTGINNPDTKIKKTKMFFKPKNKIEFNPVFNSNLVESNKELENMMEENDAVENDLREFHELKNKDWKYDFVPEIFEGENVKDYCFEDAGKRLANLKEEEIVLEEEFKKMREEMSKQIFDKEYYELREQEKEEIDKMAMGIVRKIVESNKKGNKISKAKLVQAKEKKKKEYKV